MNPKVYKRLVDEIRGRFKSADDMVWEAVQPEHLPYLHATIQEALRLIPPPAASQQRIVPPGGATVCGEFIPGGYYVAVPPFVTHFDTNFKDPLEFRPERWRAAKIQTGTIGLPMMYLERLSPSLLVPGSAWAGPWRLSRCASS